MSNYTVYYTSKTGDACFEEVQAPNQEEAQRLAKQKTSPPMNTDEHTMWDTHRFTLKQTS